MRLGILTVGQTGMPKYDPQKCRFPWRIWNPRNNELMIHWAAGVHNQNDISVSFVILAQLMAILDTLTDCAVAVTVGYILF